MQGELGKQRELATSNQSELGDVKVGIPAYHPCLFSPLKPARRLCNRSCLLSGSSGGAAPQHARLFCLEGLPDSDWMSYAVLNSM